MTQLELDCIIIGIHAPIIKEYQGFVILAQSENDFKNKTKNIDSGDIKGFYTVEYVENMAMDARGF